MEKSPPADANTEQSISDTDTGSSPQSVSPLVGDPTSSTPAAKSKRRLIIGSMAAVIVVVAGLAVAIMVLFPKTLSISSQPDTNQASESSLQSTASPTPAASVTPTTQAGVNCGQLSSFADKQVGFSFCYPQEWGIATVKDAKVSADDTGYRQMVTFSANQSFSVGGQSQDWATTTGRGIGCLEPNNNMPSLSEYNTQWHDDFDDGMGMFYSRRSLPATYGGYTIEESISVGADANSWCVNGHKVIDGSRYKIAFAGFHSSKDMYDTLAENQNNADQFFTPAQKAQYNALLASLKAF